MKCSRIVKLLLLTVAATSVVAVVVFIADFHRGYNAATAGEPAKQVYTQQQIVLSSVAIGFGVNIEEKCFEDSKTEVEHVEGAVSLLRKHNEHDLLLGLQQLGEALEPLPTLATECQSAATDAEKKLKLQELAKALTMMKHPMTFVCHVGHDLIVNGVDIYEDVRNATKAYENKDYVTFGEAVGDALFKLLVGKDAPKVQDAKKGWSVSSIFKRTPFKIPQAKGIMILPALPVEPNWEQVVLGVTEGFGLPLEEECVKAVGDEVEMIKDAVDLVRKKDKKDVISGLEKFADGMKSFPAMYKQCASASKDGEQKFEELEKALAVIKGPVSLFFHFGKNLIVNGVDIFEEVRASITAYDSAQWSTFGYNLGSALRKLIIGGATEPLPLNPKDWKPIDWSTVPKGLVTALEAAGEVKFNVEYQCLLDGKAAVQGIDQALLTLVKAKHDENITEAKEGLAELSASLKTVPDLLTQCKAAEADVAKLVQALSKAKSPEGLAIEIGKDLLHNLVVGGINIYDSLLQAVRDRAAGNGEGLGEDLGNIIADVFMPKSEALVV